MITNYILTVVVVLLLSITIVFFAKVANHRILVEQNRLQQADILHQKELLKINFEAQEKERKRIAHELHDEIGGKIHIMNMMLQNQSRESEDKVLGLMEETLESVRRISHEMYPPMLEEFGLEFILNELCASITRAYKVYYSFAGKGGIPIETELQLLRVVQEFIANTIKHSQATSISVIIKSKPGHLNLLLQDNGKGMSSISTQGLGISSINSRLEYIAGKYKWKSAPGEGVRLIGIVAL